MAKHPLSKALLLLLLNNVTPTINAFVPNTFLSSQNQLHQHQQQQQHQSFLLSSLVTDEETDTPLSDKVQESLPAFFPTLSSSLTRLGYTTPTPIQSSSAQRAISQENLLLIAPTGSGKTLAYLCPALSRAIEENGTVLVVAPTRELAVQLMRDASDLLEISEEESGEVVCLAVRGVAPPTPSDLSQAKLLIGTPPELLSVITGVSGGYEFVAGDTLRAVILDEVDVLLPPPPKTLRTSLDSDRKARKGNKGKNNSPQDERKRQEQKRKLLAAKRRGVDMDLTTKQVISPTERILGIVAMCRMQQRRSTASSEEYFAPPQLLAGSATASRKTLDRLNKALRFAAEHDASSSFDMVWDGHVKSCRPEEEESLETTAEGDEEEKQHTIRSVTVPAQVKHRYVRMNKESITSPNDILKTLTSATKTLLQEKEDSKTILLFLCGEFAKVNNPSTAAPSSHSANFVPKGNTSKARRNQLMKHRQRTAKSLFEVSRSSAGQKKPTKASTGLSARKACKILSSHGLKAQPLHVALGLESNVRDGEEEEYLEEKDDDAMEDANVYVTFEGSARGLHFDGVDVVFVVGRPSSAASYLHLAGRVGRSSVGDGSGVVIRPGTVVSFCGTKGSVKELEKWTRQIGGTDLEELVL
uniref:ATP-dependent RNA helicase n=2 Tax=Ditylum brightwellii TaxID=49249 RepID=A0A7S1ZEL8_9STRA|mmetsp:Transcript_29907/g.44476  ORF Transcript_29907/g.44476 Transcript_29907/m.44476 type:complete len:642 (+) Transcript_29907:77-2002(+)